MRILSSLMLALILASGCTPQPEVKATTTRSPVASTPTPALSTPMAALDVDPEFQAAPKPTEPEQYEEQNGFEYGPHLTDFGRETLHEEHDFGQVTQGQKLVHDFVVENPNSSLIQLGPAATSISCCVQAELSEYDLEGDQSATLRITIDTKHQFRDLMSNIVIPYLDEGQNRVFIYRVNAYIEPVIEPDPLHFMLAKDSKARVTIKSEKFASGLEIVKVETSPPGGVVTPGKAEGSAQVFEIDLSKVEGPGGAIRFETNDKTIPDVVAGWAR